MNEKEVDVEEVESCGNGWNLHILAKSKKGS